MSRVLAPSIFAFLLPLSAIAQTYVVDAANGPGTSFTDLPAAVASVPDGATLAVRSGTYSQVSLQGKGLNIIGIGNVVVDSQTFAPPVQVTGLSAGQSFSLRGVQIGINGVWPGAHVYFTDCAGPVLVQQVTLNFGSSPSQAGGSGLGATRCRQVTVRNCTIVAGDAVHVVSSSIACESCYLAGSQGLGTSHGGFYPATTALLISASTARLADCTLIGGSGVFGSGIYVTTQPEVAIRSSSSTLYLGGSTFVYGGQAIGYPQPPTSAIVGDGTTTVVRDPGAALYPQAGAPPMSLAIVDHVQPWPSLTTTVQLLGQPAVATVRGAAGEFAFLFTSYPAAPQTIPGIAGEVWVDPAFAVLMAFGQQGPGTPVTATVTAPAASILVGMRCAWQSVSWSSTWGFQLSNASTYVQRL